MLVFNADIFFRECDTAKCIALEFLLEAQTWPRQRVGVLSALGVHQTGSARAVSATAGQRKALALCALQKRFIRCAAPLDV